MNDLLCKDCKHSFRPWYEDLLRVNPKYSLRCRLSYKAEVIEKDYVVGHKIKAPEYELCSSARYKYSSPERDTNCSEQGRFWQPKHKRHLFKLIAKPHG